MRDDASLADLLDRLANVWRADHPLSLEEAKRRHPDHADRLAELWPAIQAMIDLNVEGDRAPIESGAGESRSFPPSPSIPTGSEWGTLGDYRLVREIGRGGMGVVYEAFQISLKRRVALKMLPFAAMLDPQRLQRFKNEAQAAATLHHPHIVPVYAVGCERGVHYYAMQYVEGMTLAEAIEQLSQAERQKRRDRQQANRTPDANRERHVAADSLAGTIARRQGAHSPLLEAPSEAASSVKSTTPIAALSSCGDAEDRCRLAARLGVQVAEALDRAHAMGITHRDIKPSNLILDAEGNVWVTDFGLALIETDASLSRTGDIVGTLRYMSPEQATGDRGVLDHRTDIYSLGVTLYELIALRRPFDGATHVELLRQITENEAPTLKSFVGAKHKDLETIVLRALSKEPAVRFKTAGEMAAELRRYLADQPIKSRRSSLAQRAARWTRHHTGVVWTALAAMILATCASLAAATLFNRERADKERERKKVAETNAALRKERNRLRVATSREHEQRIKLAEELYVSEIYQAALAQFGGDPRSATELLSRSLPGRREGVPDLRGFEWRLLDRFNRPDLEVARASEKALYCLTTSSDGKQLIVSGEDAIVRGYDAETFAPLFQFATGQIEVNQVSFSTDGKLLATAGDDGTVKICSAATHELIHSIDAHPDKAFQAIFHDDGESLFTSGNDSVVRRWRFTTGEMLREYPVSAPVNGIVLTPNAGDDWLAISLDQQKALLWPLNGSEPQTPVEHPLVSAGSTVALSRDDLWWAIGDKGGQIQVFATPNRRHGLSLVRHLLHRVAITSLAFSPDRSFLAVGDKGGVVGVYAFYDAETKKRISRMIEDDREHALARWQAHAGRTYDLAWLGKSGAIATVGQDGALRKWTPPYARMVRMISPPGESVFSLVRAPEEGRFAAILESPSKDRRLAWIDAVLGEVHAVPLPGQVVEKFALADDGATFAATSYTGKWLYVGDRRGLMGRKMATPPAGYWDLFFLPQSTRFFALPFTGTGRVSLIDAVSRKCLETSIEASSVSRAAFCKHGDLLAVTGGNDIEVWRTKEGDKIHRLIGHTDTVRDLAFSSNRKFLASVSKDRTLRLWRLNERQPKAKIVGYGTLPLKLLDYSNDGATIATADEAGEIRLWSAAQARELMRIPKDPSEIWSLTFSSGGRYLAWAEAKGIWVVDSGPREATSNISSPLAVE